MRSRCTMLAVLLATTATTAPVTFVLTSDVHFGVTRARFRGATFVNATVVNAAEVEKINGLPQTVFPADGGVASAQPIGPVEFLVITGDLTNRQELYPVHIQPSAASWRDFAHCYLDGLSLCRADGQRTPVFLVPGNHDVSNAIGAPVRLVPPSDPTSMVEIFNRMMAPDTPLSAATFRYPRDRVLYSRDLGGAHCVFLTLWPDRATRAWMESDLSRVPSTTPVFVFAHDPPAADAKHFRNPYGSHGIDPAAGFENLLGDNYADADLSALPERASSDLSTAIEQAEWEQFLHRHTNVIAYFHGHENWHEAYLWKGPAGTARLHAFRADSPMKGRWKGDEVRLSFEVVTFDVSAGRLTDRECRWNSRGAADGAGVPVSWGESSSIALSP